jgi:Zn-dependent M16 (insulinase) family peptidase
MSLPGKSFELLASFDVEYAPSSVKKWKSKRTGLQAAIIDKESPIVNGFFAVATEVEDDSGTPHTLEHLIFMGSKKYPYKGLLDTLGNVAFSNTNAWTATDQTVYTLTTAGWEGFKLLLPIYLDHVLNPTLTDEACYTEVYHVDGEGKEKGVVFSEMQGIQNQPWFLSSLASQRALYPSKSGYSSETGGLMENLRVLSNDTIRKFHESSYRPSNLCVIVSGSVDENEFLELLEKFDSELPGLEEGSTERPFVDSPYQIKPLTAEIVKEVEFPDKDESKGEISISWIGPKHSEKNEDLAITLLLEYLTDSSISLLTKNLVEIDEPLASELESNTDDFTYIIPYIKLNDVPTSKLYEAKERVFALLKEHANVKNFDLTRIREIIENSRKRLIFQTEKSADLLTDYVITDFLYADQEGRELSKNLSTLHDYNAIANWPLEQWVELFQKYLVNNKAAVIIGKPSKGLYKHSKAANKKLIKDRREELGEEGLKKLQAKLDAAQAKNDAPIPEDVLASFPNPDASKIKFINTKTIGLGQNEDVQNDLNDDFTQKLIKDTPKDFPLYINIDQFKSEFISIDILMSSAEIPEKLLPYFEVFSEIFTLPLEIDGKQIPYDQVIQELQNDTVEHSFYNAFQNQFTELIDAKIQIKKANYSKAISWFTKIFWNTKFTESRIKVIVDKLLNALPSTKRSGMALLHSLQTRHCFTQRSLKRAKDSLETENFYKDVLSRLENGEYKQIEADLESIRSHLFKLNNFRIIISGDVSKVENSIQAWEHFIQGKSSLSQGGELTKIPREFDVRTKLGENLSKKAFIITAPASESTFLAAATEITTHYQSEDSAAISLAASYLQAVEGPFWRGIRGTGLAYGANVHKSVETGQLSFDIYRGADAIQAYQVAGKIVKDLADGTTKIDATLFSGAVSSLVNSIASSESDYYASAASKYLDDVLKKRGPHFNTKFIEKLSKVTEEDLVDALNKYYVSIFDSKSAAVFVCAHPSNAGDLKEFFEKEGYEVDVEEVSHHNGAEEGDEDDDEGDCGSDCGSDCDSDCDSESDSSSDEESDEDDD